jgi:hypothetical protein
MLNLVPTWGIAVGFVIIVVICGEIGFHLGTRAKSSLGESPFAVLQAAIFGLLALLLAFSFSLGLARYDARRIEVAREANSIGTTYLRTQFLDTRAAPRMRGYLRQYVDSRIEFARAGVNDRMRLDGSHRSDALQRKMWDLAVAQSAVDKHSTFVALFVEALNDMIDQSAAEEAVLAAHIPDAVVIILAIVIAFASALLGIGFGRTDRRGSLAVVFFAVMLALVIATIFDLDRPQRGFIRVSLEPLQSLRQTVVGPSPTGMVSNP